MAFRSFLILIFFGMFMQGALAVGLSDDEVDDKDPLIQQAHELIKKNKYADAIPVLQKAIGLDPKSADAWAQLGYASRRIGAFSSSLSSYETALELDPKHQSALSYLGELYLDLNQPDKAKEQLAQLVKVCPKGCKARDVLADAIETWLDAN